MQRGAMQPFISVVAEQWASVVMGRLEGVLRFLATDDTVGLWILKVPALHCSGHSPGHLHLDMHVVYVDT